MDDRRGRRLPGRSRLFCLVAGTAGLLSLAAPAEGQEELRELLNPQLGQVGVRSDYRLTWFPDQRVVGQSATLGLLQHDFSLTGPLWQDAADEWSALVQVRAQEFDTDAVFPATGERFPEELWNVRLGTSYRHRFGSGWIAAGNLTVSSPSDRPFASVDELDISATALLRVPRGERDAWLFFLNYSNTRDFLPGVPVPGLGYHFQPSDEFTAVLGTGFVSAQYRPAESVTLMASYAVLRTIDVRLSYQIARPVRLWVGFDWTSERYLLADRLDADDRLFYYEKRVRIGATVGLARQLYVDVAAGYSFDRVYFVGEDYDDRLVNRLDVRNGPFLAARLGLRF